MDLWTMRCRAPGRLPWKSLATFPPRVPSPTSSTELYSFRIISWKVKTNRITGQSTATGKVPLIKERFLSKQTGPPLPLIYAISNYSGALDRSDKLDRGHARAMNFSFSVDVQVCKRTDVDRAMKSFFRRSEQG